VICEKNMYAIYRTKTFDKEFLKQLSHEEQREVELLEKKQLTVNPYVGDHLHYPFLREKKIGGKRIYFLIYEDLKVVLMVRISDKKAQQETIDHIKILLDDYFELIKKTLKQHDEYDPV